MTGARQVFGLSVSRCNEGLMSDASIMRPGRQAPEYVTSPDMAAFTIGQIVIALLADGGEVSLETVRKQLIRVSMGHCRTLDARVSAEMALGALDYIKSRLLANKLRICPNC
ncbi:hypothetical protein JHW40_23045 (plasmid) [Paracoccus alcaliphilus]|nr:hypothetical protein JHW40_23045 [Paracoccus alcaliphilus]